MVDFDANDLSDTSLQTLQENAAFAAKYPGVPVGATPFQSVNATDITTTIKASMPKRNRMLFICSLSRAPEPRLLRSHHAATTCLPLRGNVPPTTPFARGPL